MAVLLERVRNVALQLVGARPGRAMVPETFGQLFELPAKVEIHWLAA
jgi:hypothetical protein